MPRSGKDYVFLYLKGLAIGAADVVPGVSGGTIAFIAGIYEELIASLRSISLPALRLLLQKGPRAFWQAINGSFLLALLGGVVSSLVTLAHAVTFLLEAYPQLLWSFFFGLILASTLLLLRQVQSWSPSILAAFTVGVVSAYGITIAPPLSSHSENLFFIFGSGAVAICAMILPGISGAFILVLLGMYAPMLAALKALQFAKIIPFVAGCVTGLLAFSHVLAWMFKHYHNLTLSLLIGFMLGSLNKVWPWKLTLSSWIDQHGKAHPLVQANTLPWTYEALTSQQAFLGASLALLVLAIVLVLGLEKWGQRLGQPERR